MPGDRIPTGYVCDPFRTHRSSSASLSGIAVGSAFALWLLALSSVWGVPIARAQEPCPPQEQWQRSYGSANFEAAPFIEAAPDGGSLVVGIYYGDDLLHGTNFGSADFCVLRLDPEGNVMWNRVLGGEGPDHPSCVKRFPDGGWVVGGSSASPPSGNKTSPAYGSSPGTDYWVIRLDPQGQTLWEHSYGGTESDYLRGMELTADGGIILAGSSASPPSGNKTSPHLGDGDFWVVRLDAQGTNVWQQTFGSDSPDDCTSIARAVGGGFVVAGTRFPGLENSRDMWVVRLDDQGQELWNRQAGGTGYEDLATVLATADGGFFLAGSSYSNTGEGKTSPSYGTYDYFVVRLDGTGQILWDQTYGGEHIDFLGSAALSTDGGLVLAGYSDSAATGNKTVPSSGSQDYWVVGTDADGNIRWQLGRGGLTADQASSVSSVPSGGFLVAGYSDSAPRDSKTSPHYGNGDYWVLRFAEVDPADCDRDGVPNGADACPGSSYGSVVNAAGCSIAQLCPCDGGWAAHSNYVACATAAAGAFLDAGLITAPERDQIVQQAEQATCPPVPQSMLVFGLTHVALGQGRLQRPEWNPGTIEITDLAPSGQDGVSVLLQRSESGLFLYPDAPIWGNFDPRWFAEERVFGRLNGSDDVLLATVRGTKPNYETYPVHFDFSPLAPQSLTFQIFTNGGLLAEGTVPGATGSLTVHAAPYLEPRINPLWREPDGTLGAVLEFTAALYEGAAYSVVGPFGDLQGDRVVVRLDQPAALPEYVSRADVVGGGGLGSFSFLDARVGKFGRLHRAFGPVRLELADAPLGLERVTPPEGSPTDPIGVLVECGQLGHIDFLVEPIVLTNDYAQMQFLVAPTPAAGSSASTALRFISLSNELFLSFNFQPPPLSNILVRAYLNGQLTGSTVWSNEVTRLRLLSDTPPGYLGIVGAGIDRGTTNTPSTLRFTLDQPARYVDDLGTELHGNQFVIASPGQTGWETMFTVALSVTDLPRLTILGESTSERLPPLAIQRDQGQVLLSWPVHNEPHVLESTPVLGGSFSTVTNDVHFQDHRFRVSLPVSPTTSQFFRLRASSE